MRRLALAAVVGSLVLTACSDQSKQAPTEPDIHPSFAIDLRLEDCADPVWLEDQKALAEEIFPGGKGKTLLSSAFEKLTEIYNLCNKNRQAAVTRAMFFDDWMFKKFQAKLLTSNSTLGADVLTLFINVLNGVGLNTSTVSPDLVTSDAGTGVYTGDEIEVTTALGFARLRVPAGGFGDEETLLIVDKLPNNTHLNTGGQAFAQFPPFYDFDAINASNNHVLEDGTFAHVEMCLYFDIVYPPGIRIGHNPVFGAPGYPFEILEPDGTTLGCGVEESGSFNPGGLQGMATSAWLAAKRGMTALFLPQPLRAATLVIGGSIAGKTASLSPFGVVETTGIGLGSNTFGVNSGDDGLSTINLTTGAVSFIGQLGGANDNLYTTPIAMAVGPLDQKLYVWNNSGDGTSGEATTGVLLTVDPGTGLATPVNAATPAQGILGALAFTPGGTLYGTDFDLFGVNPATGVKTLIGSLGSGLRVAAADFACNGTLYGVEFATGSQRLLTINLTTGAATAVATLSQNMGLVQSILFTQSGTLVGSAFGGPSGDILFDIDPVTGVVSNIRSVSGGLPQGLGAARTCVILQ